MQHNKAQGLFCCKATATVAPYFSLNLGHVGLGLCCDTERTPAAVLSMAGSPTRIAVAPVSTCPFQLSKAECLCRTYTTLISQMKGKGRLQQVVDWCGGSSFDGCIVFDECHKAKNFVPGKEAQSTKVCTFSSYGT